MTTVRAVGGKLGRLPRGLVRHGLTSIGLKMSAVAGAAGTSVALVGQRGANSTNPASHVAPDASARTHLSPHGRPLSLVLPSMVGNYCRSAPQLGPCGRAPHRRR